MTEYRGLGAAENPDHKDSIRIIHRALDSGIKAPDPNHN
jgi:hypothetical protein